MTTTQGVNRTVDVRLASSTFLDADHVRGEKEYFVNMVARIVKEGFRPYFHALGLLWEENA